MNLIKSLGKMQVLSLFLVYLLANITYLLNTDGLYFDDWVVYNQDYSTLALFFDMLKNTIHGYYAFLMLNLGNGIYSFRLSLFVMYFFSGLFIIAILKSTRLFAGCGAYVVGFFYLVSPVFHTKGAISIIPFYLPVFLFFFAFYLLSQGIGKLSWKRRLGILALFFTSFTTGSLLMFYMLVLLFILYKECFEEFSGKSLLSALGKSIKSNLDFLILPLLFFWFKSVFLVPWGIYHNYNKVNLATIESAFSRLYLAMDGSFYGQLEFAIERGWKVGVCTAVFVLVAVFLKKYPIDFKIPSFSSSIWILIVGVIGLGAAVFPYLAVNKFPLFTDWSARFQVLTILPVSLILYALIMMLAYLLEERFKRYFIVGAVTFLVAVFVGRGIYDQHRYNMDWFYHVGIQEQFLSSPIIKDNTTFVVVNGVRRSMVYKKAVVYYDWNGLLKQAYGDDSRLMVTHTYVYQMPSMGGNKHFKQYNYSSWVKNKPIWVNVDYDRKMTKKLILKLYWARLFNESKFRSLAKELVKISFR